MAEFKQSRLCEILAEENMLTQDAWDFVDSSMDDFCVDETKSLDGETFYELRGTMRGYYKDSPITATEIYYGNKEAMAALIEYFAQVQELIMNDWREKDAEED